MSEKKLGRKCKKIATFMMAWIMAISSVGFVPMKVEAAGRKIVKKLTVEQTSVNLEEGETEKIKYNVTATKGTSKKIQVKVSNKKVISAKVSGKKIVIKAKKKGKSTITVMTKAKNKNGKKIAKKIQVVVTQGNYDDDELEYDFEDNESYEEDEAPEVPVTTEKAIEQATTTEAPTTTEKATEQATTTEAPAKKAEVIPSVTYQAYVQDAGWQGNVKDGAVAGTTGKVKCMESIKILLNDAKGNNMLKYRAHVQDTGWQGWKTSGQAAGTEKQSKRIEAIQIQLTGAYAEKYDIYYSVHVTNFGWLGWAKNGETAGSEGLSLQVEAIKIRLVKKNEAFSVGGRHAIVAPKLTYQAHCADIGWKGVVTDGNIAGTVGENRQLEALKINLADTNGKSGIEYRAHVSDVGWQGWKNSGEIAGTTGQAKKLEAVEIKLKGDIAKEFDIYYRVHVADIGWLGWAKNGETAGTTGGARQAEAVQIKLVGKGGVIDRGDVAYQKLTQTAAGTAAAVVSVAASQVGYYEKASAYNLDDFTANRGTNNYTKYARDIGVSNGLAWCATFICWCMKQAGVSTGLYPYSQYVPDIYEWFKAKGLFRARGSYTPKEGDFIIFGSGRGDHVGIVERVSNGIVYTIEGNSSDSVRRNSYYLTNTKILGYGVVNYPTK